MSTNLQHVIAEAIISAEHHEASPDPITAASVAALKFFKDTYRESDGDFDCVVFLATQQRDFNE